MARALDVAATSALESAIMEPDEEGALTYEYQEQVEADPRAPLARTWFPAIAIVVFWGVVLVALPSNSEHHPLLSLPAANVAGVLQTYALQRRGRSLSEEETYQVMSQVGNDNPRMWVMTKSLAKAADGKNKTRQNALQAGLNPVCADAVAKKMQDMLRQSLELLVDSFFDCVKGHESNSRCQDIVTKMVDFLDDVTETCKKSGDVCTFKDAAAADKAPSEICVPADCHEQAQTAIGIMKDELDIEDDVDADGPSAGPLTKERRRRIVEAHCGKEVLADLHMA